jgi:hypothetical protein
MQHLLPLESFNVTHALKTIPAVSFPAGGVNRAIDFGTQWGSESPSAADGQYVLDQDLVHDYQSSFNNATCNVANGFICNDTLNTALNQGHTNHSFDHKSTSQVGECHSASHQQLEESSVTSSIDIVNSASNAIASIDDVGFNVSKSYSLIWSLRRSSEPEATVREQGDLAIRSPQRTFNGRSLAPAPPGPRTNEFLQPRRYTFAADAVTLFGRRSPDLTFIQEPLSNSRADKCKDTKGRRINPLSPEVREHAKKSRQLKLVCIRCKKDRQAVSLNVAYLH